MIFVGTDILLLDGDVMFNGDAVITVSGEDNIQQQAYLRLLTDKGESVYFPDYGTLLHNLLAKPYNEENKKQAESEARAALLQVGDASGQGWIEKVLECKLLLAEVDGKEVKMLFVKYLIRGESQPRELKVLVTV